MQRLEEIIELIEITGDKLVILHKQTDAYVVMKFDDYKSFYHNRLKDNKITETKLEAKPFEKTINLPKQNINLRPIPPNIGNIKEYEIPSENQFNEDIYYPEPFLE